LRDTEPLVGAFIIEPIWREWGEREARATAENLARAGANAIVTEASHYRDDVIDWVHATGMRWIGGIACFSDYANGNQAILERPELWPVLASGQRRTEVEGYLGVVPTFDDYNAELVERAASICRDHELDGFVLDFIRWPLHWELELRSEAGPPPVSSFDSHTIWRFETATGIEVPHLGDVPKRASWILEHVLDQWVRFRCAVISELVDQLVGRVRTVKPLLPVGMYVVPLPPSELAEVVGQDLERVSPSLDFIAPMLYHKMVHRPPGWIETTLRSQRSVTDTPIVATLQVDSAEGAAFGADWGPPIPVSEWSEVLEITLRNGVEGLILWTGTALLGPGRGEVLRKALAARSRG
jgi:hypothetical protein